VTYVPEMRTQLVAARTVAEALVELATAPKVAESPIPEIAGPRVESLVEMAKLLAVRRGDSVRIEGVSDPADPDRGLYLTDALLPGPPATLAGPDVHGVARTHGAAQCDRRDPAALTCARHHW
jgi:uncharacterized protein YbjT (DUF2867 family)